MQQCGKKRAADGGDDEGVEGVKKARTVGRPVKIGREEAAEYWQSLIDAGRERGIGAEKMKMELEYTSSNHLRSLKLKGKATKARVDNKAAFLAAMHAKKQVNLVAQTISASTMEDVKFDCIHCDKAFSTRTSLGQHVAAKHIAKQ